MLEHLLLDHRRSAQMHAPSLTKLMAVGTLMTEVAAPKEDKKKPKAKAKAKGKKKQKKTETDADSAEDAAGGRDEDDDEEDAEPPRKKPASRTSGHRLSMSCGQPILRR